MRIKRSLLLTAFLGALLQVAPLAAPLAAVTRFDTAEIVLQAGQSFDARQGTPNPFTDVPLDWARTMLIQLEADRLWSKEADITAWLNRSRLNASSGLRDRFDDPRVQQAMQRFLANVRPGVARLVELVARAAG